MKREDVARKTAVEAANGASEKKPYVPPSLKKRERLIEVAEGSLQFLDGRAGSHFIT